MQQPVLKNLICAGLVFLSPPVFACKFMIHDHQDVRRAVNQRGGYPLSDEKCGILNKNGMSLHVAATSAVLNGVNLGAAFVSVSKSGVTSDTIGQGVSVNTGGVGSQDVADDRMVAAINDAITSLDFEKAIEEVLAYTAKLKTKR